MKIFDIRFFLRYRRVSLRSFWPLWGNKLLAEKCIISLLCILFDSRNFVKNRRAPLRFFSGTVTQNNFDETSWYLLLSLIPKSFRHPKLVIHWRVPNKSCLPLWHKKLKEKRDIPSIPRPTLTYIKIFDIRIFPKHRGVPLRSISLLRNKHFWSTVVMPRLFLSLTFFPSVKLSETQKGSSTKCFGTVKQNSFTENRDTPPVFMHEKFRC